MSVTTVPFMDLFELNTDEYELDCGLCPWYTVQEHLPAAEDSACDHLDEAHPRRTAREHARQVAQAVSYRLVRDLEDPVAYG